MSTTLTPVIDQVAPTFHVDVAGVSHLVVDHGTYKDVTFVLDPGVGTLFITWDPDESALGWRVDPCFTPDFPLGAEAAARLVAQLVSATALAAELTNISAAAAVGGSTARVGGVQ